MHQPPDTTQSRQSFWRDWALPLPKQAPAERNHPTLDRRLLAEGLGSFFLFACVIGSGIMAAKLSDGNQAIALLGNTLATGTILFVLITIFGPISGAHMNPAVSLVAAFRRELAWRDAGAYIAAQLVFGVLGAWAAHVMFALPVLEVASKTRGGFGQCLGEFIATFGLILTILGTVQYRRAWVPRDGSAVYYGGLLVHLVNQFCQSGDHRRPQLIRHVRRDRSARCPYSSPHNSLEPRLPPRLQDGCFRANCELG